MTPLFKAALELMLNSTSRSHALAGAAVMKNEDQWNTFTNLYNYVVCQHSYDEQDATLGINAADEIYNYIFSLNTTPKCP